MARDEALSRAFARVERWGVRIAVVALAVALALYVSGVVPPLLSRDVLVSHWGQSADAFSQATGQPTGWDWLGVLGHSDMLGLAGLVLLFGVVMAAYAALLVPLLRKRDFLYLVLVLVQVAVFVAAAAGWPGVR